MTAPTRRTLIAVNVVVIVFLLAFPSYRIDLDVYRIGARVWLGGGDLYGRIPVTRAGLALPFTYPPLAAVLAAPLTLIPMWLASLTTTAASITLVAVVLRSFLRADADLPASALARLLPALLPVVLLLEPVRFTLGYGQVNVLLTSLVVADCLTPRPGWPRGAAVGLAAAVKLTPAVFLLFFLPRRDFRDARTAAVTFVSLGLLGLVLAPGDSWTYWTSTVFQTGRIGGPAYAGNQSLTGMLARLDLDPRTQAAAWAALSIGVGLITVVGMRRSLADDRPEMALVLNAFAGLLVSPVSWSHHWVLGAPAALLLVRDGRRCGSRTARVLGAGGLVIFATSPHWWLPSAGGRELRWAPWEQLVGSSYVLYAATVLGLAAFTRCAAARSPRRVSALACTPAPWTGSRTRGRARWPSSRSRRSDEATGPGPASPAKRPSRWRPSVG